MKTIMTIQMIVIAIGFAFLAYLFYKRLNLSIKTTAVFLILIFITSFISGIGLIIMFYLGLISIAVAVFLTVKTLIQRQSNSRKKNSNKQVVTEDTFVLNTVEEPIYIKNPFRGVLVAGGAGSGKSRSVFYPMIKQLMDKSYSGLLYDFKSPELSEYAHSVYSLENSNVNLAFVDFKDFRRSHRINPISPRYLTKQAIAFELAIVLVNNLLPESIKKPDYWSRSSVSVIAGAIWYLRNNHPEICSLPHLIAMLLFFPSSKLIEIISKDMESQGMISSIMEAHTLGAEKQLSGVVGTIKNSLSQLNLPELFFILSKDNVNLDLNSIEEPTFLCIGNDSTLSATYAPIISTIISTCLRKMNEPHKTKSACLIDELPTIYIPNLEQLPATARSNRISTIVGIQDYSQMIDKYGQEKSQVLRSNLGNQFYGRTVNEKSAKMISDLFDKEDKTFVSRSSSTGSSSRTLFGADSVSKNNSESQSIQQRERVKVSDITNLAPGRFYGLLAEGDKMEVMGEQLSQVEETHKPFRLIHENVDLKAHFKQIYDDVSRLSEEKVLEKNTIDNDDFKIELN